jgi:hypothetical protein
VKSAYQILLMYGQDFRRTSWHWINIEERCFAWRESTLTVPWLAKIKRYLLSMRRVEKLVIWRPSVCPTLLSFLWAKTRMKQTPGSVIPYNGSVSLMGVV